MNQTAKNSLFIGDLAIFCTDEDLYTAFCQFGEISVSHLISLR